MINFTKKNKCCVIALIYSFLTYGNTKTVLAWGWGFKPSATPPPTPAPFRTLTPDYYFRGYSNSDHRTSNNNDDFIKNIIENKKKSKSSKTFRNSSSFTKSNEFTHSRTFEQSSIFSTSNTINPSQAFKESNTFSTSNVITYSEEFKNSKMFSNSKFTPSQTFAESNAFNTNSNNEDNNNDNDDDDNDYDRNTEESSETDNSIINSHQENSSDKNQKNDILKSEATSNNISKSEKVISNDITNNVKEITSNEEKTSEKQVTVKDISRKTKVEALLLSKQARVIANRMSMITLDNVFKAPKLLANSSEAKNLLTNNNINNNFVIWSRADYDYYNGFELDSFFIPNFSIGGEYNFGKNNDYKVGLAYTYGFNKSYIQNNASFYANVDNIGLNNFITAIVTYGNLKDNDKDDKHDMNLISLNAKLGQKIRLSENNILAPIIGIKGDHFRRNDIFYKNLVITPIAGMIYSGNFFDNNLNIQFSLDTEYNFNLRDKNYSNKDIIINNKNDFVVNGGIGIGFKIKNSTYLNLDANTSYDMDKIFNVGFSFGIRVKF